MPNASSPASSVQTAPAESRALEARLKELSRREDAAAERIAELEMMAAELGDGKGGMLLALVKEMEAASAKLSASEARRGALDGAADRGARHESLIRSPGPFRHPGRGPKRGAPGPQGGSRNDGDPNYQDDSGTAASFGFSLEYQWLLGARQNFAVTMGGGARRLVVFGDQVSGSSLALPTFRLSIGRGF